MENTEQSFQLGEWHVYPRRQRLEGGGGVAYVEPKVMDVLVCLSGQPQAIVTRTHLMDTVWPDVVVGDEVLTRAISELRKAFGDDYRAPQVIETIPKVGYRLLLPVYHKAGNGPRAGVSGSKVKSREDGHPRGARTKRWVVLIGITTLLVLALGALSRIFWPSQAPPAVSMQAVPLTSFPGLEIEPAFSPNETQVAFARRDEAGAAWHIYAHVLGTESVLQLTDGPVSERHPTWSADGRYVAFARDAEEACGLYLVPVLGGAERKLETCDDARIGDLTWSPDGTVLAYSISRGIHEPFSIFVLSLETHRTRRLTAPTASASGDYYLTFSSNGEWLAFVREAAPGVRDVYRVSVREGGEERLTSENLSINGLDWMPDDRFLLFSSYHGSNYNLWQVPASGGPTTWVAAGPGSASNLATTRAGRWLAYVQWQYDTNIWRTALHPASQAAASQPFIASTQADTRPQFSPDGTRIAFVSSRTGMPEIWLSDIDGSRLIQLTSLKSYHASPPRWSPDGRYLTFDLVDSQQGTLDIYVVDAAGGLPMRLTTNQAADMAPSWSRDGRWIYFGSDRNGIWQIWKMPAKGGPVQQVTSQGGLAAQESLDGQSLYYIKPDTTGLWRRPVAGGAEVFLPVPINPTEDGSNWVIQSDGCYFIERSEPGRSTISYFDFATETTTAVLTTEKVVQRNAGLSVSPDGQWMLYTQEDNVESDLMLVEQPSTGR